MSNRRLRETACCTYFVKIGSFAWNDPSTCPATSCESVRTSRCVTPTSKANLSPASRASYSAWLLLVENPKRKEYSNTIPPGPSRTTPAPLPLRLDEPSTDRIHFCVGASPGREVSSTMKSARDWDLILVRGLKLISYSESSTAQDTILPARSGFLNTCFSGKLVFTWTGCPRK